MYLMRKMYGNIEKHRVRKKPIEPVATPMIGTGIGAGKGTTVKNTVEDINGSEAKVAPDETEREIPTDGVEAVAQGDTTAERGTIARHKFHTTNGERRHRVAGFQVPSTNILMSHVRMA
jgi:hypothetical protein